MRNVHSSLDITQFYSLAVLTRFQPFNSLEKEKAGKSVMVPARSVYCFWMVGC